MININRIAAIAAFALVLPFAAGNVLAEGDWDGDGDYDVQDLPPSSKDSGNGDWTTGDWDDHGDASTDDGDDNGESSAPGQDYGDNPNPRDGRNMNR